MNKLLREFLFYILEDKKKKAEDGTPKESPTYPGHYRVPGTRNLYSTSPGGAAEFKAVGRKLEPITADDAQQSQGTGREQPAPPAQPSSTGQQRGTAPDTSGGTASDTSSGVVGSVRRLFGKVTSTLSRMTQDFRAGVYSGDSKSIGTKESTQGETSSCAATQDFIEGSTIPTPPPGEGNEPVPANVSPEDIEAERAKLRGKQKQEPAATRRAIMNAWINKERQRYIDANNKPPSDEWLTYAYRAGLSTAQELRNRGANLDATKQALNDGTIPPPTVASKEGRQASIKLLQDMAGQPELSEEDRMHYDQALHALEHAEDTDTLSFYIDKQGRVAVLFISNKQTKSDPHGNTTPGARVRRLRESAAASGVDPAVSQKIEGAIAAAEQTLQGGGDVTVTGTTHLSNPKVAAATERALAGPPPILSNLQAGRETKDYSLDVAAKAGGKVRGKKYGKAMAQVYCTDNPTECKNGLPIDDEKLSEDYMRENAHRALILAVQQSNGSNSYLQKILMKVADAVSKSDNASMQKLFKPIIDSTAQVRQAAKDAHEAIVSELHAVDEEECKANPDICKDENGNPVNGPATQVYVDSFMRDTHWDQYICNTEDCTTQDAISATKLVDIDGHKATPQKFRECLGNLTGFKSDKKPDSHDYQRELWAHLKRTLKTSPTEASISVHGSDNVIGKEKYRTKGERASLLTYLGKNMADCVTGKTA